MPLQTEKNIVLMFIFKLTKPFQHYPGLFFLTRVAGYYDLKKNVVGIIGKKKKDLRAAASSRISSLFMVLFLSPFTLGIKEVKMHKILEKIYSALFGVVYTFLLNIFTIRRL